MSIKNVYYEITSFENLLRADKNCASQHTDKWEIIEFRRNLEENLLNLRDRLRRLDYSTSAVSAASLYLTKSKKGYLH